jgi:hypothetical protein
MPDVVVLAESISSCCAQPFPQMWFSAQILTNIERVARERRGLFVDLGWSGRIADVTTTVLRSRHGLTSVLFVSALDTVPTIFCSAPLRASVQPSHQGWQFQRTMRRNVDALTRLAAVE